MVKLISKLHNVSICINNLTMLIMLYKNLVYSFFCIYFAQLFILSIRPFLYLCIRTVSLIALLLRINFFVLHFFDFQT